MEEESRKSFAQITLYNQLIKEMDDLYRVYAKNCNLSETAFWILYCIQEREKEAFTQREICDYWFYTPQTVNSALKNMTEEGVLILRTEKDNRKNKRIYLTEKGKETVERIVVPLMDAERRALAAIGEQEAEILLKTMKKHTEFFRYLFAYCNILQSNTGFLSEFYCILTHKSNFVIIPKYDIFCFPDTRSAIRRYTF